MTRIRPQLMFIFWLILGGCVEPISFEIPPAESLLVVEGYIADSEGPHKLSLSYASSIEADSITENPAIGARVFLLEDGESVAQYVEVAPGKYEIPEGTISGVEGRFYNIELQTDNGKTYKSVPDQLNGVGTIEQIHTEFESRTVLTPTSETDASVLKVLVDGNIGTKRTEVFTRWKFQVIYEAETFPMNHIVYNPPYDPLPAPFPCSGFIIEEGPVFSGGLLVQVGECECCECWARIYESAPTLSTGEYIVNGNYANVLVGQVPITSAIFYKKAQIRVDQMSVSRAAFDFFNLLRSQKENAQSIFQPASGEITGNIEADNVDDRVVGVFYATSIMTSVMMINSTEVPYPLPQRTILTLPCAESYPDATYDEPELWE